MVVERDMAHGQPREHRGQLVGLLTQRTAPAYLR